MDFDSILFYVIGIIILIISIVRQNKKRNEQRRVAPQQSSSFEDIDDNSVPHVDFESITSEEPEVNLLEKKREVEKKMREAEKKKDFWSRDQFEDVMHWQSDDEKVKDTDEIMKHEEPEEDGLEELADEETEEVKNIYDDFDPRKAIIYSEILNRKGRNH